jgi:type I restriction enzyme S subunit
MGSDWQVMTLDEVCDKITDGSHQSPKSVESGKPMASVKDLRSYGLDLNTARHISRKDFSDLVRQGCQPEVGDVLIAKDGNSALDTVCTFEEDAEVVLLSSVAILRPKQNQIIPRFLKYYFCSQRTLDYLKSNFISGAAIPRVILKDFKRAEISLPLLKEQKAIAHILGSLDDKIELNRQMNQTLESMAQALFKSWFVDFDPVIDNALAAGHAIPECFAKRAEQRQKQQTERAANKTTESTDFKPLFPNAFEYTEEMGWIPKGWGVGKLNEFIDIKYGKNHKKLDEGTFPVYGSGGIMRFVDQFLYKGESVLIPRKGTLSNLMYVDEEFWSVDTMFYSVPKMKSIMKFVFYYLNTFDFVSMNVGSAVPSMTTKVLNDINTLKSSDNILNEFDRLVADYFNKRQSLDRNNNTLKKFRDTLLPKLLSGEIRIPDAEKLIAEVE